MNCQLFGTFLLMGVILTATSTSSAQPEESPEAMIERIELPLKVEPLEIRQGKGTGELKNGTPGWRGPVRLPRVAWVFRALTPGSLKVTLAEDPETVLEEGRDYLLDPDWAAIARAPESKYPEATKVAFEFQYTQSRLDLVEKGPGDQIRIRKGEEHMTAPVLPEPAEGWTPWASIYMPHNTTRVTEANLKRIDPEYDGVPPVLRGEKLDALKARIAKGDATIIAFLGDSITAMGEKDLGKAGNFVDRFARWLGEEHRDRTVRVIGRGNPVEAKENEIVIIKAGVGGDDTRRGLKRLDPDVLAHKPHVVFIMFGVNDENRSGTGNSVPVEEYRKNLREMVDRVKAAGAEPVLMTTSMKNLEWEATAGNLNEYADAARSLAQEQDIMLIDHFAAWENLPRRGYDYMILLGSCINHPVDAGHELFLAGIKRAFAP